MRVPLAVLTALLSLIFIPRSRCQPLTITTLAGSPVQGSADGTGGAAHFANPWGVAADTAGNLYVADTDNHTIRKITIGGTVSTFAGLAGVSGSADGTGSVARFYQPQGVAVDTAGNVYVADTGNYTIRKITSAGAVSTLAGSPGISGSTDATGGSARFYEPEGIAVNNTGTILYVADTWNHTIRQVTSSGTVTTFAGSAGNFGTNNGTGSSAQFYQPQGIAVDSAGNVYVGDTGNQTIRKITSGGVVTTLAGSPGNYGSGDGSGTSARFWVPQGLALDNANNLYVADSFNNTIRKVTSSGVVTTLAGTAGSFGTADGTGAAARFWLPQSTAVDGSGNLYVADSANGTIRKITSGAAVVTTLAGSASTGNTDDTGSAARFDWPSGAAIDNSGTSYVADTGNSTIRTITPAGVVSTLAGSAGNSGSTDATGSNARFYAPQGVAVDTSGNTYVADTANHTIRKVTSGGVVSTLAGLAGTNGLTDGTGTSALFNAPQGVAVSPAGVVYVADTWNHTIREVTAGGVVTTLAGLPGYRGSIDGTSPGDGTNTARFYCPAGVAADASGNVYVADTRNHTVRKVTSAGVVSTLAGLAGVWGSADGTNSDARFDQPEGITVDAGGNLYVLDTGNHSIRMVAPTGTNWVVTTVAGMPAVSGSADGNGNAAQFSYPTGIGINNVGAFAVADWGNNTIRAGGSSNIVVIPPAITNQPQGLTINEATSATFTVGVSGTAPFSYQWLFNGANISTGTGSSYTLVNAQPSDSGSYSVVVANAGGSVTSAPAILTVNPVPTPPGISAQPQDQIVSQGSSASFSVTATGSTPFAYQWLFYGSNFAGATASSLGLLSAQPADAGPYSVIVTNAYGSITSSLATLTVIVAPVISVQPTNRLASVSNTVSFTVGLSQGTSPAYQWRQNGAPIAGATQSSLMLASILWGSAGTYSVVVSNSAGSQTSAGATLIVEQAAFTFFDGFESYNRGSLDNNTSGGPNANSANPWWALSTATPQGWVTNAGSGVTPHGGSQMAGSTTTLRQDYLNLLYRMNAGQIYYGNFMCDWWFYDPYGSTSSGATNSQEYLAVAQYAPVSTIGDTSTFTTYNQRMSLGAYNGSVGYNYLYYQARIIGGLGTFGSGNSWYNTATLRSAGWHHARILVGIPNPANYAQVSMYIDNMISATVTSGGTNLGYNLLELNHDMASVSGAGWYYDDLTFRAANDPWIVEQPVSRSASPGQPASFTTVAVGTAYQWQFNGADIAGATTSSYGMTSVAATNFGSYACLISGTNGTITTSQAVLTVTGPPVVVAQPASLTVTQSQDAAFSVTPAGTTPLSFQWQFNNTPISGATGTNYTLSSAQSTNAGSYSVVVTNAWGSATSAVATLTVLVPPSIASGPLSLTVTQGQNATFTVTPTGSTPLVCQWQFNALPVPGATATNYTVADAQPTNAGGYSVVITNALGSITSSVATLTVLVPPSITNQPQSQIVLAGTCANFFVAATGSAPLAYQWQWNGVPQADGTLTSYTACNAGSYSVLVSNLAGVALSDTATLTLTNSPAPVAARFNAFSLLGDGSLQLNMSGAPYSNYSLQFTADWTNWSFLASLSATNGLFQFNDPSVATNTERFYRLQLAP
jgi:sugar lactone lactonase YvrE